MNYLFPIDYFGAVSGSLIEALVKTTGDKRKRLSASRGLTTMAKACKAVPREVQIDTVGLTVDKLGQLWLVFYPLVDKEAEDVKALAGYNRLMAEALEARAKACVASILDEGLAQSTFRDKFPEAYDELKCYRADMIDQIIKVTKS